jgi:hypothetical protein
MRMEKEAATTCRDEAKGERDKEEEEEKKKKEMNDSNTEQDRIG